MGTSLFHLRHQGAVIRSLLETGLRSFQGRTKSQPRFADSLPGPVLEQTVAPRPGQLVRDYLRHTGGDPSWYRGIVPAHFFPQWGFPILAKTLRSLPYDLTRVLNLACRMQLNQPLPIHEPLLLRANLEDLDDNGQRVIFTERLVTSTASAPQALECDIKALIPLPKSGQDKTKPKKEKPRIPHSSREIGRLWLSAGVGLEFALLTGDFNPVHWIGPVARLSGFRNTIMHGYATLARSIEVLNKSVFSGNPSRLVSIEVGFVRPLVLPAQVSVFIEDNGGIHVGPAPGGPAYLTGHYEAK